MEKSFELDAGRLHIHVIRDMSTGFVTFTLSESVVHDLYYASLVNSDRADIFLKLSKLLKGLF